MDNRYSKLGKNTLWMTIGSFSTKLLSFFLVPLYTNCLSTAEYGISDLLTTTVNLLIPFLTITASEGILRLTLEKNTDKKQIFSIAVNIFSGGFIVFLLISFPILEMLSLSEYILYFIFYYITAALSSIFQQFTKGLEHMRILVFSGMISSFVTVVLNIFFLLFLKAGIEGYLTAMIIGNGVQIVYLLLREKLWRYYLPPSHIDKQSFRVFLDYCIPLIPNSLSWWVSNSSDRYMIAYFDGAMLLGIYSVAYKIPSIVSVISNIFTGAWQISAVDNFGDKNSVSFFEDIYHKYSSLYVIGCSGIILFIKVLSKLLFAKEFYAAWSFAAVLTFAVLFQAMGGFLGIVYAAAMQTKQIFLTTVIGAVTNMILNVMLIPFYGAMGAALATLVSYFLVWMIRLIASHKILPMQIRWGRVTFSYVCILLQIWITISQKQWWLFGSCLLFGFVTLANKNILKDIFTLMKSGKKII